MANYTDWLNISQMSGGTGETSLTLTALTNSSLSAKTATVTAKNTTYNVEDTTTVTIEGFVPTLTLSHSTLRFDSTGGTATFTVYSNTAWTISYPALVHSYSTAAGTGDTEVTVILAPNPDEVAKVDTGIVKDVYNVNELYLTVVQESFITELTVTPDDDITFVNTGSSTSVTIDTNTDWEIDCPYWITPSVVSGESGTTTVTFAAEENGPTDRSGVITIYAGSKYVDINVFQPFYIPPYITVTPSAWTFNYTEDGKTFIVDSYPEWTAEIIATGESVWDSAIYMEATFDIPSAMTMPLYSGAVYDTYIYYGPILLMGSSITFESGGTYKIRYEIQPGDPVPSLKGNTYLTNLYFSEGVTSLPYNGFSGCTNLTGIVSDCEVAPSVLSNTFYGVATGGTLIYPPESDYSTWLSDSEYYLGYYFWGGIDDKLYKVATITYNVTSTTNPTNILYNSAYITAFKTPNGPYFISTGNSDTAYTFSETGKQVLEFYGRKGQNRYDIDLSGVSAVTDLVIEEVPTDKLFYVTTTSASSTGLTALSIYSTLFSNIGSGPTVKIMHIGGNASGVLPEQNPHWTALETLIIDSPLLTGIGGNCFSGATALTSVTIESPIATVGASAFKGCTSLSSITFPDTVTSFGNYCFSGCTGLQNVAFQGGSMGTHMFLDCNSLTSITSTATVAPSISNYTFFQIKRGGTLRYPAGCDYSSWLKTGSYYLGYYDWTGEEINI